MPMLKPWAVAVSKSYGVRGTDFALLIRLRQKRQHHIAFTHGLGF
jgi:hypothetical protein